MCHDAMYLQFGALRACCTNGLLLEIRSGVPVPSAGQGLSVLSVGVWSQEHGLCLPGPPELLGQHLCCQGEVAGWETVYRLPAGLQGSAQAGDFFLSSSFPLNA